MRVTSGMTADNALYNLQLGRSKLDKIQEQISSGLVINRPSDDPISTRQILNLEGKIKEGEQYLSNIKKGNLWLSVTNTALTGIADVIEQAKKVAGTIPEGSSDPKVVSSVVSQLTELKKQLVSLGNTQLGDQYVFAGFKNSTAPFDTTLSADPDLAGVPVGTYLGSDENIEVEIDKGSLISVNVTGTFLQPGPTGGVDIMGTLDQLIKAIQEPPAGNAANIKDGISKLSKATTQVVNVQADVAGRMIRMESAQKMVGRNQSTLQSIITNMQNVDYVKAATELNQQKTAFEAALSTTAKITNLSLLDYLQ